MSDTPSPRRHEAAGGLPPHVFDDACGITYDPGCPCWGPGLPSPDEIEARRRDELRALRIEALGPEAREALVRLLRPEMEDAAACVLADDLPELLASTRRGVRHGR